MPPASTTGIATSARQTWCVTTSAGGGAGWTAAACCGPITTIRPARPVGDDGDDAVVPRGRQDPDREPPTTPITPAKHELRSPSTCSVPACTEPCLHRALPTSQEGLFCMYGPARMRGSSQGPPSYLNSCMPCRLPISTGGRVVPGGSPRARQDPDPALASVLHPLLIHDGATRSLVRLSSTNRTDHFCTFSVSRPRSSLI